MGSTHSSKGARTSCRKFTKRSKRPRGEHRVQQENRASNRDPGAIPVLLRDARQRRADRGRDQEHRGLGPVGFLPGQRYPPDRGERRRRSAPVCLRRAWPIRPPRPLSTSRSRHGAKPPRATNRIRKQEMAARNWKDGQGRRGKRDLSTAKYHHYELASAAFQIGIVLASAAVITGDRLAWLAGGLGIIGLALLALGLFAPHAVHHFL